LNNSSAFPAVENSGNKQLDELGESFEPDQVDPGKFLVKGIQNSCHEETEAIENCLQL